jgi:hypothetical protein
MVVGKVAIGLIAFAAGAAAGALAVKWYIKTYPLEALAPGAAGALVTKLGGNASEASAASDLVHGLVTPNG